MTGCCAECVQVCDDLALKMIKKTDSNMVDFQKKFEHFRQIGPTPGEYIYEKAQARDVNPSFTDDMYDSKLQKETNFVANGVKVNVLPPDYTFSELRVSHDIEGIYKTIRGGLGGGLMPAHADSFSEKDILAIAHYVNHLVELGQNDPAAAHKLRDELRASLATPWVAPVAEGEEGEEGEDSGDTEAAE